MKADVDEADANDSGRQRVRGRVRGRIIEGTVTDGTSLLVQDIRTGAYGRSGKEGGEEEDAVRRRMR